ncbi:MAG: SDR family NAD(P)-dependent oxidoreductase [Elusimicrobia bacterium]|nr:SDR family NAD(P)-dependent oxidoreductase [Elusimicrobiota bacterium]
MTGGTGSAGQAIVRHLLTRPDVTRVCVASRDELKQARMAAALGSEADVNGGRVRFFLTDVRDIEALSMAMRGVDIVIHAAALKRVDAIAYNPSEVLKTNVDGTWRVCLAAIQSRVKRVVFISSDKSVAPTTHYGASKFMAERLVIGANTYGAPQGTELVAVRYGNVAGSRGSVIHTWRNAVANGLPLSLTDERMTRFWLTLDEAVQLVMFAANPKGVVLAGDTVVPVLPSFRVKHLLQAIAGKDAPYAVTGRRSGGEKLHESLLSEPEIGLTSLADGHYIVAPEPHPWRPGIVRDPGPFPADWQYSSDTNTRWLGVADLKRRLALVPDELP